MVELVGNLHMHTPYSDGEKYHRAIAEDAIKAGLDFIVVTDHNIWVDGVEGYVSNEHGKVLVLCGQEVHDVRRDPQCNHMLIYGAERELSPFGNNPQTLIDEASAAGGLCFLAHPHELPLTAYKEKPDLGWKDWEIDGYTGLEIWNYMSSTINEMVRVLGPTAQDGLLTRLKILRVALNPERYITAPEAETLAKWDALLATGKRVVAIGNSDAHGTPLRMGPIKREIYPYDFLFRAVNTHLLVRKPLSGDLAHDKQVILNALGNGNGWVGYDFFHPTAGFRFSGQAVDQGIMGDVVRLGAGATLQVKTPARANIRLLRHGKVVAQVENDTNLTHIPFEEGAYRVECTIRVDGKERGWIYSNPIYLS
jgi:hypothetical protein